MLNKLTKEFPEIDALLQKQAKAKKALRAVNRKLKTQHLKYKFIQDVIGINSSDTILTYALKLLFKNIGFTKVVHFKSTRQKVKREDLQLYHDNDLFLIEAKGIDRGTPNDGELGQVRKYIDWHNKNNLKEQNIFGITILNLEKKLSPAERQQTFKHEIKNTDLLNGNYACISTLDLIIGFWLTKTKKQSFEDFKNKLKQKGIITYSNGGKILDQIGLR